MTTKTAEALANITPEDVERFNAYVDKTSGEDGCWLWTSSKCVGKRSIKAAWTDETERYGMFWLGGTAVMTHRFAYTEAKGPIPDGAVIDHICRKPSCVNPNHLEAVTQHTNTHRGRLPGNTWGRGEKNGYAKLTAVLVREIRKRFATEDVDRETLAAAFGISKAHTTHIIAGHAWKHSYAEDMAYIDGLTKETP